MTTQSVSSLPIEKITLKDMEALCRICFSTSALVDIFPNKMSFFKTDALLVQQIMEFVKCDIKENDNQSQKICIKCIMNAETAFKFKRMCEQTQLILNSKIKENETSILAQTIEKETLEKMYEKPEKSQESEQINILEQKATDVPQVTLDKKEYHLKNNENPMKSADKPEPKPRSHGYNLRRSKGMNETVTAICKKKIPRKTISKTSSKVILLATQLRMCLRSHTRSHGEKKKIN